MVAFLQTEMKEGYPEIHTNGQKWKRVAWTIGKECSKRKKLHRSRRLETVGMFWLMDPRTMIGTSDHVSEPTSAMTWDVA